MGLQIIKQPNELYCLYSSNTDNVAYYDCTLQDIIDIFANEYIYNVTCKVNEIKSKLDKGEKPYNQFTLSFEQMLENIKEIHGEEEFNKTLNLFKNNGKQ